MDIGWRTSIGKSGDGEHWLVWEDNCTVPSAFDTFEDAVAAIAAGFGISPEDLDFVKVTEPKPAD